MLQEDDFATIIVSRDACRANVYTGIIIIIDISINKYYQALILRSISVVIFSNGKAITLRLHHWVTAGVKMYDVIAVVVSL